MEQETRRQKERDICEEMMKLVKITREAARRGNAPLHMRFVLALEYFAVQILIFFRR